MLFLLFYFWICAGNSCHLWLIAVLRKTKMKVLENSINFQPRAGPRYPLCKWDISYWWWATDRHTVGGKGAYREGVCKEEKKSKLTRVPTDVSFYVYTLEGTRSYSFHEQPRSLNSACIVFLCIGPIIIIYFFWRSFAPPHLTKHLLWIYR